MESPYDTKCRKYKNSFLSKYDCIERCMSNSEPDTLYIYNLTQFLTSSAKNSKKQSRKVCANRCPRDCQQSHYSLNPTTLIKNYLECEVITMIYAPKYIFNRFEIELLIEHNAQFSLLFLIVQFGALVGFYFGLSINDVSKATVAKIRFVRIYLKKLMSVLYSLVCIYQIILVLFIYFKYQTVTKTVLSSYKSLGMFPSIEIKIKSSIATPVFITNGSNIKKYFEKLESVKWNGQKERISTVQYLKTNAALWKNLYFNLKNSAQELLFHPNKTTMFKEKTDTIFLILHQSETSLITLEEVVSSRSVETQISQQTFELLPPPYDTDCYDYHDLNNSVQLYDGRYGCEEACQNNLSRHFLNCLTNELELYSIDETGVLVAKPTKETNMLCDRKVKSFDNYTRFTDERKRCIEMCKQSCRDFLYKARTIRGKVSESNPQIRLRFDSGLAIKYVSTPKMTPFDLFYEVGGLLCLWFPFSLIDFIYLFSKCLRILMFI